MREPELSDAARRFLAKPGRFATLATLGADGAPHQAVVWYLLRGDGVVVNSREGRGWPTDLDRDPRASLAVEDGYHFVIVEGAAARIGNADDAQADIAEMARAYHADDAAHAEDLIGRRFRRQRRVSFAIRPDRVRVDASAHRSLTAVRVAMLAGGFGGAKMAHGFSLAADPADLSVIVNVADDLEVHGLHVSPDLDTVMYTLAGLANEETGWGVRDETWSGSEMLARYGAATWFRLGDRDVATNLLRTERLAAGKTLTEVTAGLSDALGIGARLLPATDDRVRSRVRTPEGWLDFQEYFVRRHHADEVLELKLDGIDRAVGSPAAVDALRDAEAVVIAPSNPFLSVAPILALDGLRDAAMRSTAPRIAISPIVGGAALRGPADRIFVSLGGEASALGVARHYTERYPSLLDALVIDRVDAAQAPAIEALGLRVLVEQTVMRSDADRAALARTILGWLPALRPTPPARAWPPPAPG